MAEIMRIFFELYRFSSEGTRYLILFVGPYGGNDTQRSRALTVEKKYNVTCYDVACYDEAYYDVPLQCVMM